MKIVLITSEELKYFPPIITLLHTLDRAGHEVTMLVPYPDGMFEQLGLKNASFRAAASEKKVWLGRYYQSRLKASAAFHMDRLLKRAYIGRIPRKFQAEIHSADVVWVLHENTVLLGGKRFVNQLGDYLYTMYELCIKNGKVPAIYDYAARKALLSVVPEYCRAHITKAFYALPQMPAVIPNKPAEHPRRKNLPVSDPGIAEKIARMERSGKKIIMYMGILSRERPLEPVIEAVEQADGYVLAVLGGRTPYLDQLERDMGGRFVYLGEVAPPLHLEIASHADVAYISYVPQKGSINAVFCAPNKVYEFAGFGIPMLCNDNPGLKFTVEYYGMGVCAADLSAGSIKTALSKIDANAAAMGEAAKRYYDMESVEQAVAGALGRYRELKEGKHA